MDESKLLSLVQTLDAAVAVTDPETWTISFENAKFFEWFTADGDVDATVPVRIPEFDPDRAASRIGADRPYSFELKVGSGARARSVAGTVRRVDLGDEHAVAVIEVHDVTKQREAEYLLDSYSKMVERNTRELEREKDRVEKLLLNIMPRQVYEEMREFGSTTPQRFDASTILMLDFVGFTSMAISHDPGSLISELNYIFTAFDRIVELFNAERMKTIGDAYMAVSGLPEQTPDHAHNVARVALRMRRYIERRNASHSEEWRCRIGIHSGPVIGSIVGVQKYVYDVFGPGVNLAARMEALAEPMQIVITEDTYQLIRDDFTCTDLGDVDVKGFGTQRVYSLDAEVRAR
jgi:adenylate cyclase